MDIESQLQGEIVRELGILKGMEVGSDPYTKGVDGVAKLMDRAIELEKINIEVESKTDTRLDDQKDRLIKNCIAAAGIVVPSLITIWGTLKSMEFEKEGTITTIMGRGFINKLLPKK